MSPEMLFAGIGLLLFFSKVKIYKFLWLIALLSSTSFSVYLIHCEYHVWNQYLKGAFAFVADVSSLGVIPTIICISFLIYMLSSLVEMIRRCVFECVKNVLGRLFKSVMLGFIFEEH